MPAHPSATASRFRGRWALLLCAVGLLVGVTACAAQPPSRPASALGGPRPADAVPPSRAADVRPDSPGRKPVSGMPSIAGLGPKTLARIPAGTRQVLVATGESEDSSNTRVTLWTADADGRWTSAGHSWAARNARDGWTTDHHTGDLHSPIGVFTLSDAGGRLPNPGTRLPYHRSDAFVIGGSGFEGEPLAGSFDYVVAIDYNRVPGRSPLDTAQPMGSGRGGGIWLHVDHGGPTHGCVTLAKSDLVELMTALDPAARPLIVMGPAGVLAR